MKQSSRRKKGKVLQNLVRDKILKFFPHLRKKDVDVARNGENGADIKLSKVAKCLVPYSFETKNQEKMKTIYDCTPIVTGKHQHLSFSSEGRILISYLAPGFEGLCPFFFY